MTTKNSPLSALRKQADYFAKTFKAMERGEPPSAMSLAKLAEARLKPTVKTAVVMDDKTIIIEIAWSLIAETSEAALSEYVLGLMQERAEALQ